MTDITINYLDAFPDAIAAEGKGRNLLVLSKLDRPQKNASGQKCVWELVHRSLAVECEHPGDGAYARVLDSEVSLYPKNDVDPDTPLFDQFRLFP